MPISTMTTKKMLQVLDNFLVRGVGEGGDPRPGPAAFLTSMGESSLQTSPTPATRKNSIKVPNRHDRKRIRNPK